MRVKFCGITRIEDAREAARLGAWAIGLIHHEASSRNVAPEVAAAVGSELRRRTHVVGVFVNAAMDEVVAAAENESLTMLQLHGDEGPGYCREAARRTGCRVIKATRVRSSADIQAAEAFRTDYHLFDAYSPSRRGGTGSTFDWELLAGRSSAVPAILSGGLDPANVTEAARLVHPFAVDVSSGVEASPGIKDHALLASFAARAAAIGLEGDGPVQRSEEVIT